MENVLDRGTEAQVGLASRRLWVFMAGMALSAFLAPLNSTTIAVALPEIGRVFSVGPGQSTILVVSYLVAQTVVMPIAGKVGDLFDRRTVLLVSLAAFAVVSIATPLAPSFGLLVGLRVIHAAFGAAVMTSSTALVREWVPGGRRGAMFGILGTSIGMAAGLGPPLGGILVGVGGWSAVFWMNVPLAAAALAAAAAGVPRTLRPRARERFDWSGAVLIGVALLSGSVAPYMLRGGGAMQAAALGLFALVVGYIFVRVENRSRQPLLRLSLFQSRTFASAAATATLARLSLFALIFIIPQFLRGIQGRSEFDTGLILGAFSMPMIVLAPLGGRMADRFGTRVPSVLGVLLMVAGGGPLLWLSPAWGVWPLSACLVTIGCGVALNNPAILASAVGAVREEHAGMASGLYNLCRFAGSIVGVAAMGVILGPGSGSAPAMEQVSRVFFVIEAGFVAALFAAVLMRRREFGQ